MQLLHKPGMRFRAHATWTHWAFSQRWPTFLGRNDGTINRTALAAYDRWVFPLSLVAGPP